jgi:hypothetical protein
MSMVPSHEKPNGSSERRVDSRWPEIIAAAQKPEFRLAEFVRLILTEMSFACHELSLGTGHSSLEFKIKPLMAEINALRTLAETARYATESIAQADVVNLDGPKFLYVLDKLVGTFKQSALDAGCNNLISNTMTRLFADKMPEVMKEIHRDIKKVGTITKPQESVAWSPGRSQSSAENTPSSDT